MRWLMIVPLVALSAVLLLLSGASPLSVGNTAWSAAPPVKEIRILKTATVNHKEVSLAEVCDPETLDAGWKSILGVINIGEAPSAGSEKFIDPAQLRAYLEKLLESQGVNSSEVTLNIPDKVIVRRESVQITQEQIEEIFKKFVLENSPWKQQEITVQRVHFSGLPIIPTGTMSFEVNVSPKERFIGNVTATIDFFVNGEKARTLGVVGRVEVFGDVYLASRPLKQNDMLTAADLETQRINLTDAADRFATRSDQVENHRVLHNIGMHQPIELKNIDKPLVLKRGDPVMIVYDQPGLSVTAKGQVNSDGGVGDTLAVVNVSSKKTIYCKVVDAQTVRAVR